MEKVGDTNISRGIIKSMNGILLGSEIGKYGSERQRINEHVKRKVGFTERDI